MNYKLVFSLMLVGIFVFSFGANAKMYVSDYNVTSGGVTQAHFVVQTLKYEPYPVVPGEWFNVWVKAENIGEDNAENALFQLMPNYPFSSNESLTRSFGLVPGTVDAYNIKNSLEDSDVEANQVIMEFRVKVADNAPSGISDLKIKVSSGNDSQGEVFDLPISIEKSDVSFQSVMQSENPLDTSFTLGNTGSTSAGSVTVTVNGSQWNLNGDRAYVVGNLNGGDFSKFTIEGTPKSGVDKVDLEISYTDVSGARRVVTQEIPVSSGSISKMESSEPSYLKWIFGIVGILIGVAIMIVTRRIHNNRRR